ncbi:class I SAM-dependent methyltransferase [Mycobacterium sp. CVI_P3]|uniref:Class I SAM-dependent methyltransferase n=1 Tax=Mycobacterium pinniadriaticum TaxID=2994102 RepID=A0ABT3SME0_9MYCO|nr:class I SAM-dependent methyltransferase [Mycobacterium pinniadriaticum]MCX2933911.1 class I SAM-dependent methyltransferase [Mycobacterium pinniadriaticum]MCX2940333.1 class I SAM-dependent methyltransferase [Mycobacterium pinniadriaticum]
MINTKRLTVNACNAEEVSVPTLSEIMDTNRSDKGTATGEAHGYTAYYERWLEALRNEPLRVLEIGVCDPRMPGASLKGWYEYFPHAKIFGYDIVDGHRFDNDRVVTFVGDQSDRRDLERFVEFSGGEFDVIIDDGSHRAMHQQVSLAYLFPHLKPGGQYIIEDMHVAPNTVRLLRGMQRNLPGDRTSGSDLARRIKAFTTAARDGALLFPVFGVWPRAPYIAPHEVEEIRTNTTRLDLVCDNKLARFIKKREG